MKIRKLLTGVAAIFAVTLVVTAVVTYLWSLVLNRQGVVDWGLSFRLAIILGIVLPATRAMLSREK